MTDWQNLPAETLAVYDVINRRRDVRNEFIGRAPSPEQFQRVLQAAHAAPSVGNTQPWDFVVIDDPARLAGFAAHVAGKRAEFAAALPPERRDTFNPIKIDGIVESGAAVVVTYDRGRGGDHVLGRRTVEDTGLFSVVLAVQNLWLAATAEGLGVGWVSFYDEAYLADYIGLDPGGAVRPIAWLCIGEVSHLEAVPDLVRFGWRQRRPLAHAVHRDRFSPALNPSAAE